MVRAFFFGFLCLFISNSITAYSEKKIIFDFKPNESGYLEFGKRIILYPKHKKITYIGYSSLKCHGIYKQDLLSSHDLYQLSVSFYEQKGCHNKDFKLVSPHLFGERRAKVGEKVFAFISHTLNYGYNKNFILQRVK